jgi:hypothetical protein
MIHRPTGTAFAMQMPEGVEAMTPPYPFPPVIPPPRRMDSSTWIVIAAVVLLLVLVLLLYRWTV